MNTKRGNVCHLESIGNFAVITIVTNGYLDLLATDIWQTKN